MEEAYHKIVFSFRNIKEELLKAIKGNDYITTHQKIHDLKKIFLSTQQPAVIFKIHHIIQDVFDAFKYNKESECFKLIEEFKNWCENEKLKRSENLKERINKAPTDIQDKVDEILEKQDINKKSVNHNNYEDKVEFNKKELNEQLKKAAFNGDIEKAEQILNNLKRIFLSTLSPVVTQTVLKIVSKPINAMDEAISEENEVQKNKYGEEPNVQFDTQLDIDVFNIINKLKEFKDFCLEKINERALIEFKLIHNGVLAAVIRGLESDIKKGDVEKIQKQLELIKNDKLDLKKEDIETPLKSLYERYANKYEEYNKLPYDKLSLDQQNKRSCVLEIKYFIEDFYKPENTAVVRKM